MNATAVAVPSRPALRYFGGKWNMGGWIISHFPKHRCYLEPCAGSAAVLLQKPRAELETISDVDDRAINYFDIVRSRPSDLVEALHWTPWAEGEYLRARETAADPLEDARRFFCLCFMSIPGGPNPQLVQGGDSGFRFRTNLADGAPCSNALLSIRHLYAVAERLRGVHILRRDALAVIEKFNQAEDQLIYFDPPYLVDTRRKKKGYSHEFTIDQHVQAAELLNKSAGYVAVSGYATNTSGTVNTLYRELYEAHGWRRIDKEFKANSDSKKIESLWLSPRTWQALEDSRPKHAQLSLL